MPSQQDPDFERYPETVLHFNGDSPFEVDLRRIPSMRDIERLRRLGLDGSFAVVTAHDPEGRDLDAAENERRNEALANRLTAGGISFAAVDACSPDGKHRESSVAIETPLEPSIELARDFGQVAIFWFDGSRFWIESVIRTVPAILLPR